MDKKLEIFHIQQYFTISGIDAELISCGESPDFIYKIDNIITGIELSRIKIKKLSAIAGDQRQIVRFAMKKAIDNKLNPLEATVFFDSQLKNISKKEINDAAEYLFEIVNNNLKEIENGKVNQVKLKIKSNKYGFSYVLVHWNVFNGTIWLDHHRWKPNEPGFVSTEFSSKIRNEIKKKNKKYFEYRKKCDQCWLIFVIDRSKKDELFDYSYMDKNIIYESNFDSTIIFDLMEKKIYNLKTIKSGNCA